MQHSSLRPAGYEAHKTALVNAILAKRIRATVVEIKDGAEGGAGDIDVHRTRVPVEQIREWLESRRIKPDFFFPAPAPGPDYLNRDHPNYSAKLAAAIEAWAAVSESPELLRNKSVKQALLDWLREHRDRFGLTKVDGSPNELAFEEIAKVCNWQPHGGAPRTPGRS